jgi:hypothetical protein
MKRKYNNIIRCVKNWDGEDTGWWAWSDFLQSWHVIPEQKMEWLLDFLPDKPSMDELLAEAYFDAVFDPFSEQLVFANKILGGKITDEDRQANARCQ